KPSIDNIDVNSIAFFNAPVHSPDFQMPTGIPSILPPPTNNQLFHLPTPKIPNLNPSISQPSSQFSTRSSRSYSLSSGQGNKSNQCTNFDQKREMRLERNRVAAKECRERKKAYVQNLERKATEMQQENATLRKKVYDLKAQLEWAESKVAEKDQLESMVQKLKAKIMNMEKGNALISSLALQEVDELIEEWHPEPLVSKISEEKRIELEKVPVVNGPTGPKVKLANGKILMNLASFDFLGCSANEQLKEKAVEILRRYGVGSCGPPGFYGTIALAVCATESLLNLARNPSLPETILSNTKTFKNGLANMKYAKVVGSLDSPIFHLRLNGDEIKIDNVEEKDKLLQEIVDEAMNNGILLTRAKYVRSQENFYIEPSIRVCISAAFTKKEIEKAASTIKNVITKVLKNKIKLDSS
ncbi:14131_t:CDS:2, partial [Acaulospora colombiana]